jgi:hypothetical protein
MSFKSKQSVLNDNTGNILIIVALFLPVALALLALSINNGTVYYAKSAYTSIANTSTASAISTLGDEMVKIVEDKMTATPPFVPTSSDIWDNLTDDERIFLTTDPTIVNDIKNYVDEYLHKNIPPEALLRNDFVLKDITIEYPYNYDLSDNFVKVHLEFRIEAPISFIETMTKKDILIKAESQIRIK